MIRFLQRITNHTKDNRIQNRFLLLKIGCMLIVAFLSAGITADNAQAATGLQLYEYATKKETTYTGKQIKVTVNGTAIGKEKTPGILVDGVAMVPYNDIFLKTDIDAECIYNKEKGTVCITKYGTTIQMTIGSTKATVNGKTVTMPVAPKKVKYMKAAIAKILVPSRFVSENLGLGYTWNSSTNTVSIVKNTMLLSYNKGKKFEYTGVQGLVTIDGKKVSLGAMPSIITNNTAMLRAKKVFSDSAIGARYQFNVADNTVTLSKGETVLVMTIGSTIATLNGNKVMLDTAPIIVKNYELGSSFVMVPGGFTASCLGYDYTWSNTKKTSMISSQKKVEPVTGGSGSSDPELGDSGVITETGTILAQWFGNETLYGKGSTIHELNSSVATSLTPGYISLVSREYNNYKQNTETYMIVATAPFGKITSSQSAKIISIQASGNKSSDQTYQMFGVTSNYVNTIGTYNNTDDNSSTIQLDMMQPDYSYDISLSADQKILYVTVYLNTVTSAIVGTNTAGDYITLTGINSLNATITEQSGYVYIDLPNTVNGLGELYSSIIESKYINLMYSVGFPDRTQIVLGINPGYEYYISENDNQYSILFQTPGMSQQPAQPTQPTETPVVIDKSKYEIVIPKPQGITGAMISNEDDYFNNRFYINLPGDYTGFYDSNGISFNSSVIEGITVSLNSRNETGIEISTSRLQGYEVASDNDNIYINIGEPKDIYKNIVVLDPGHGGGAKGAQYFGTMEKDMNFKILYTIGKKYFNSDTSKLKVYFTRISDVDMSLSERAAFAGKYDADLFVSLHMNASTSAGAFGTEVYYSTNNNKANSAGLTSKGLASLFVNNITNALGTSNRGAKAEQYTVVHRNTVPAVLIELGFISNKNDYANITNEAFQDNAAKTIFETLLEVFASYPTGR